MVVLGIVAWCLALTAGAELQANTATVVLLADCHMSGARDSDEGPFRLLTEDVAAHRPDLVLVLGDIGEGRAADYDKYDRLIAKPLEAAGARVHAVLGNHDNAAAWVETMGRDATNAVVEAGGAAFLLVFQSTRFPGGYGEVTGADMDWLRSQLAEHADKNCFVVLHHPLVQEVGFREWRPEGWTRPYFHIENGEDILKELAAHPSFRGVLSGHVHANRVRVRHGVLNMSAAPVSARTFLPENPESNPFGYWLLEVGREGVLGAFHEVSNERIRAVQARHPEFHREMLGEGTDVRFEYDYETGMLRHPVESR